MSATSIISTMDGNRQRLQATLQFTFADHLSLPAAADERPHWPDASLQKG